MAKPGPKRKPKTLLKLSGGWRGKRRGDEPKPEPPDKLKCPAWLRPAAKTAWRNVRRQLETMGILTMADEHLLALYCQTWAQWREADKFVVQNGESYTIYNKEGRMVGRHKHPEATAARQLLSELTKMGALMGLSPTARAALAVDNKNKASNESDEKAAFFKAG